MKLNRNLIKKGLKNQIITIIHMIIFNFISFTLLYASNIGTKPTGNIAEVDIINIQEYHANLFFVIFFWIIFLLSFSVFYTKFLKKDFIKQMKIHWIFILIFFIFSFIFILVEYIIFIFTQFMATGFFCKITNYPEPILYTYIVGYILIDIIREIVNKK